MISQRPEMTNQSHQLGARWVNQANPDLCCRDPLVTDRGNTVEIRDDSRWSGLGQGAPKVILMSLDDLRPGMRLGVGMHNREGHMLLGPEVSLPTQYIARLRDLGCSALWVDDEDTRATSL